MIVRVSEVFGEDVVFKIHVYLLLHDIIMLLRETECDDEIDCCNYKGGNDEEVSQVVAVGAETVLIGSILTLHEAITHGGQCYHVRIDDTPAFVGGILLYNSLV